MDGVSLAIAEDEELTIAENLSRGDVDDDVSDIGKFCGGADL